MALLSYCLLVYVNVGGAPGFLLVVQLPQAAKIQKSAYVLCGFSLLRREARADHYRAAR
jgi:hypothetical protein